MQIKYIQIDTGLLKRTISDMKADIENMKKDMAGIYQDIHELDTMWEGPAKSIFNSQFETDRQEFMQICNELVGYVDKMVYATDEYNKCESRVNEIINSIRV